MQNPDGSLTNKKDGTVIRPDFKQGFFVNDKGEKVGVGFRTFAGFHNYTRILTDPRIRGPFFRIFLWTFAFSAISVLLTFALGILLSVLLEQPDIRFRRTYRTLFILPYAVPGVLSILIMRGLFNQEFGAVNEMLRGILWFRSGMGNQSLGGSRNGFAGESLAGLPLHDAYLHGDASVDSLRNL